MLTVGRSCAQTVSKVTCFCALQFFLCCMVPVQGWILCVVCTIITIFEIWWDTSRRYKQQSQENKNRKNESPYFPTWSWLRMNTQYILCLINIWISITIYQFQNVFWILFSIVFNLLFWDQHFMLIRTNATYLRLKYITKRNPFGTFIFIFSAILMIIVCLLFNLSITFKIESFNFMNFTLFWNCILFIITISHTIHFIMYYIWAGKHVFGDSKMSGSSEICKIL